MHEVQRLDERWNRAYQTRDHAALEDVFAADWIAVFADGRSVERAAFLEQLPHNPPATLEFSEFVVRVFGDTAVTWGRVRISVSCACGRSAWVSGRRWLCKLFPFFQRNYYNKIAVNLYPYQ